MTDKQVANTKRNNFNVNLLRFVLFSVFAFLGSFAITDIYRLISQSYLIDASKLIRLDTVQLINRAFRYSSSKGSPARLEFESTSRHKFRISAERFYAIAEINKLTDTLMYHETQFLVYTNSDGLKKYKENSKGVIEVYQLVLDDKEYVDILQASELTKDKLIRGTCISAVLFCFVLFGILRKTESDNYD
jgi:hypothetical protein